MAHSRFTGRTVTYRDETLEEAYASRGSYGAPAWEIEGWVSTYTAIAAGDLDAITGDVARLSGHEPISIQRFLAGS